MDSVNKIKELLHLTNDNPPYRLLCRSYNHNSNCWNSWVEVRKFSTKLEAFTYTKTSSCDSEHLSIGAGFQWEILGVGKQYSIVDNSGKIPTYSPDDYYKFKK